MCERASMEGHRGGVMNFRHSEAEPAERVRPDLGPVRPDLERVGPDLRRVGPDLERVRPDLDLVRSDLSRVGSKVTRLRWGTDNDHLVDGEGNVGGAEGSSMSAKGSKKR